LASSLICAADMPRGRSTRSRRAFSSSRRRQLVITAVVLEGRSKTEVAKPDAIQVGN
jgi:hypothetical protein